MVSLALLGKYMVTLAFVGFDMVSLVLGRNFMVSPTLIGS